MKTQELREMEFEELKIKLNGLKEEHFNLRFQHGSNQLEKTSSLKSVRREIARVQTIIREKQQ